jgi:hypothetical protein
MNKGENYGGEMRHFTSGGQENVMLKVSQAVPACPSDKDRMKVKTLGC